ncbi:MAG: cyclase family protein [Methanocorpusculum sp.]|nr:cyclase family protein [Methanocorpusculum sp.]
MIYDVSTTVSPDMETYPGDPVFEIEKLRSGKSHISKITLCTHSGTHIDAPAHFFENGLTIDKIPAENFICEVEVTSSENFTASSGVIFKNYFEMNEAFAKNIVSRKIKIVGCDKLSIGDDSVHKILLGAGVIIIEMLDLSAVTDGFYKMTALPLKISGADGAPARVILEDL